MNGNLVLLQYEWRDELGQLGVLEMVGVGCVGGLRLSLIQFSISKTQVLCFTAQYHYTIRFYRNYNTSNDPNTF